jgi:hypothetical protein
VNNTKSVVTWMLGIASLFGVFLLAQRGIPISTSPDSAGYQVVSSLQVSSLQFWHTLFLGFRPFTVPLFYWLCGSDVVFVKFQQLMLFGSWLVFSVSMAALFDNKALSRTVLFVLLFGVFSENILFWDKAILSETLSISFGLLWLSMLPILSDNLNKLTVAAFIVVTLLFANCRDTNLFIILLSIPYLICLLWKPATKKFCLMLVMFLLVISYLQTMRENMNTAWLFPLENITAHRILNDPDYTSFFARQGMPIEQSLVGQTNKNANDIKSTALKEWLQVNGKTAYEKFMVTNPRYDFALFTNYNLFFNFNLYDRYATVKKNYIYAFFANLSFLNSYFLFFGILGVFLLGMIYRKIIADKIAILGIFCVLDGVLNVMICYLGDAMEIKRHSLMGNLFIAIGIAILFFSQLRLLPVFATEGPAKFKY